ncbi:DUF4124 domain-containing protein [Arenimonas caeni]|uniref:DUF4124 domain-containing protein n=1 Tax=Arenimonas caeni TaxID=2058085 RepID=UPI003CFC3CE1
MKHALSLCISLLLLPSPAPASVYTCRDANGGKVYQQTPCEGESQRAARCVRSDGSTYEASGGSCPLQPGLVTDIQTGQQRHMVPQGGNRMLDPATGQSYEVINPPQPQRPPRTMDETCASERARLNNALSNPKRTVPSIRAAEDRWARFAGQCS